MSSNKSVRVLVAAALAVALSLSLAGPAAAAEGSGISLSPLERLAVWFAGIWMPDPAPQNGTEAQTPRDDDEHPEGCRGDYAGCVDPNGIILPPPAPIRRVP
jgi:hypothetical protein